MPTAKRERPLLVGEQNPYGGDPHFALYPTPEGCSGHRLCCLILGMRRADYLREFDRVNLCEGDWSLGLARSAARKLRMRQAPIILFGAKVCAAFGVDYEPFTALTNAVGSGHFLILPHPSGRNRRWNEDGAFARARHLVAEVVPGVAHLLGALTTEDV